MNSDANTGRVSNGFPDCPEKTRLNIRIQHDADFLSFELQNSVSQNFPTDSTVIFPENFSLPKISPGFFESPIPMFLLKQLCDILQERHPNV